MLMKCLIAYNPVAGRYPSRLLVERAARVFRQRGWNVKLELTHSGQHITELARQAADHGLDCFIIAGGDGSVSRAVAGLVGTDTALGVLPAGTSNVWAQELGLLGLSWTRWMALEESASRLAESQMKFVDVGVCNGQTFLLWAGIGLDGFIVNRIEPRQRWEKHFAVMHYAASVVWHASFWHGMNLGVRLHDEQISGHFLLAVVSNIRLYAGGIARLSPNACLDDGKMDLWLFEGETLGNVVQLAWELWSGNHIVSDKVQRLEFHHLRITADSPIYLQLDGEPGVGDGGVSISVMPKALKVLVPQSSPQCLFSDYQFTG
jgi:YegS/Rv2252/BmrU family lipid kinase